MLVSDSLMLLQPLSPHIHKKNRWSFGAGVFSQNVRKTSHGSYPLLFHEMEFFLGPGVSRNHPSNPGPSSWGRRAWELPSDSTVFLVVTVVTSCPPGIRRRPHTVRIYVSEPGQFLSFRVGQRCQDSDGRWAQMECFLVKLAVNFEVFPILIHTQFVIRCVTLSWWLLSLTSYYKTILHASIKFPRLICKVTNGYCIFLIISCLKSSKCQSGLRGRPAGPLIRWHPKGSAN